MLDRLLQSVYRAFDKAPLGQIAIRISHPDSVVWRVSGRVLSVGSEPAGTTHSYDLKTRTLEQLALDLEADGFQVVYLDTTAKNLSAAALVAGEGVESRSNGDAIYCYRSLLWSILDAIALELEGAGEQIPEALDQITLTSSGAHYLDLWGYYFDVPRPPGVSDDAYREWIVREVTRLRMSTGGIELAIKDATGFDVVIDEPWRRIFTFDVSALDGPDCLYDGDMIDYHVIQPIARSYVDWDAVMPIVHRNRGAGISVLNPVVIHEVSASYGFSAFSGSIHYASATADRPLSTVAESGEMRQYAHEILASYSRNTWRQADDSWAGIGSAWPSQGAVSSVDHAVS